MKKRILSMLLVLIMVVGMIPASITKVLADNYIYDYIDRVEITIPAPKAGKALSQSAEITAYDDASAAIFTTLPFEVESIVWYNLNSGTPLASGTVAELGGYYSVSVMLTPKAHNDFVDDIANKNNTFNGKKPSVNIFKTTDKKYVEFFMTFKALPPVSDGALIMSMRPNEDGDYILEWNPTHGGSTYVVNCEGEDVFPLIAPWDSNETQNNYYTFYGMNDYYHNSGDKVTPYLPCCEPGIYTFTVEEYDSTKTILYAKDELSVYITPVCLLPLDISVYNGSAFNLKLNYQAPAGSTCTFELLTEGYDWISVTNEGRIIGTVPKTGYINDTLKVKMTCSNGYSSTASIFLTVGADDGLELGEIYITHGEIEEELRKPVMGERWEGYSFFVETTAYENTLKFDGVIGGSGEQISDKVDVESHLYLNGKNLCCKEDLKPWEYSVIVPLKPTIYTVQYRLQTSYNVKSGATVTYKGKEYPLHPATEESGNDPYFEIQYGVYDILPTVHSFTVNGQEVKDGDTLTIPFASGSKLQLSGKLDYKLSEALDDLGCTLTMLPAIHVNGQSSATAEQTLKGLDGNAAIYEYSKNMDAGDLVQIRYSLIVTWKNGFSETVSQIMADVRVDNGGMLEFQNRKPNWMYTPDYNGRIIGSVSLYMGNSYKVGFTSKPLTAAQIAEGYSVKEEMRITKDGVDFKTFDSGAEIDLADYVDGIGEYVVWHCLYLQKDGVEVDRFTIGNKITYKQQTISSINVTAPSPIIGALPVNDASLFNTNMKGFSVVNVDWTDLNGYIMKDGETFVEGKKYLCIVKIKADSGFSLPENRNWFNGSINNTGAEVSEVYSTEYAYLELEVTPVKAEILKQPENALVIAGQKYTGEWKTSFVPAKTVIVKRMKYTNGRYFTTNISVPANETSYNFPINVSGDYEVRFYYTETDYISTDRFTVKETAPAFTLMPQSATVPEGQTAYVEWKTNFTPVKLVLSFHNATLEETHPETFSDPTKTYEYLEASDNDGSYYWIRAYYSDTEYVTSDKIYVTRKADYTIEIDGVTLESGYYLEQGSKTPSKEKTSDNYVYYEDGVLYMHWYSNKYAIIKYSIPDLEIRYTGDVNIGGIEDDSGSKNAKLSIWGIGGTFSMDGYESSITVYGDVVLGPGKFNLSDGGAYVFNNVETLTVEGGAEIYSYCSQGAWYIQEINVIDGSIQLFDAGTWQNMLFYGNPVIKNGNVYFGDNNNPLDYTECTPWDGTSDFYKHDNIWIINKPIEFLEIPESAKVPSGKKHTITWSTNETPASLELLTVDKHGNATRTELDPTITSLELSALPDDGSYYWLIAYDENGKEAHSYDFCITEAPYVYVGGVGLYDGYYLTEDLKTYKAPLSDNYAYYSNGVLTLYNFDFSNQGYEYFAENFAMIYSEYDLEIYVQGYDNYLTWTNDEKGNGVFVRGNLSFTGGGRVYIDVNDTAVYTEGDTFTIIDAGIEVVNADVGIFYHGNAYFKETNVIINSDFMAINGQNSLTIEDSSIFPESSGQGVGIVKGDLVFKGSCIFEAKSFNVDQDSSYFSVLLFDGEIIVPYNLSVRASTEPDGTLGKYDPSKLQTYDYICVSSAPEAEDYLLGDVNNDGAINSTDYLRVKGHFIGTYTLEGTALLAGDVNKDSVINSTDYLRIKGHFIGTYTIEG